MQLKTITIDDVIWVLDEHGQPVGTLLRPQDREALERGIEDVYLRRAPRRPHPPRHRAA